MERLKFFFLIILVCIAGPDAWSKTIVVRNSIPEALKMAEPFDTLIIEKGTYKASDLRISKPLTIIGKNYPLIDGGYKNSSIVLVSSDNVNISGLEIKNVGVSSVNDNAAIKVIDSKYCKIENNRIINAFFGIYLAKVRYSYILNNSVAGNNRTESRSGNGIHLWQCSSIVVNNNFLKSNRDGIYFEFVSNSRIQYNTSMNNLRYGLHFMFSDNCVYTNNKFISNGAGVAVMYTKNIGMEKNIFADNWGPSSYGLLLKDIVDSYIKNNEFRNNTIGIYAEGSNRISISGNNFRRNGWAVKIMANCINNTFKNNNFLSNTFDIATNSKNNYSHFSGNYWSSYKGYDLNKDGFGDIPYHPVSLFSYLAAQNEPVIILLRSLFIELLDMAESVFPSITPETLLDKKPLMKELK